MKYSIVLYLQYEALHCWTDCPYEDVSFLKHPHRHMFHIRMKKAVTHTDRDIEIIRFKWEVQNWLDQKYNHNLDNMSCEMLAAEILTQYGCSEVEVTEDGEHGAVVEVES